MGRGRTHHFVTKQKIEDQSRRLTITMDHNLMKMKSGVNAQRISEESVTCIAIKEDSVEKRESKNRGQLRVVRFINLLLLSRDNVEWLHSQQSLYSELVQLKCAKQKSLQFRTRDGRPAVERDHREHSDADTSNIRTIESHIESSTPEALRDD